MPVENKNEEIIEPILCDFCGEEIESILSLEREGEFFYHLACLKKLNYLTSENSNQCGNII